MSTPPCAISPNRHISEFLDYYCGLDSPDYAVMISGKWGSGKTWFIEQEQSRLIKSGHKFIYVSLYGITECDQIQTEFFKQLHPVLSHKGVLLAGKLAKGLLRGALKIDLDDDGKADGSAKVGIPDLDLPEYLQNTEDRILIFDDLERSAIPVDLALGYINSFVEHGGHKVLIIANEDELFAKSQVYPKIKEKVIGKTFEMSPEIENAFTAFKNLISSKKLKQFAEDNTELILRVYNLSQYRNLRHLRQCLQDLDRFFDSFSTEVSNHEKLMINFIVHFFIYAFEIKAGAISENELLTHESNLLSIELGKQLAKKYAKGEPVDSIFDQLSKKYFEAGFHSQILSAESWVNILCYCKIDIGRIEEELKQTSIWLAENVPDWIKLWETHGLSDSEFEELSASVFTKFTECHYKHSGQVLHIAGMFIEFSKRGIINTPCEIVVSTAREVLDKLVAQKELIPFADRRFRPLLTGWKGKGFHSRDDALFVEFSKYLFDTEAFMRGETLNQIRGEVLDLMSTSGQEVYDKIASHQLHLGVPFLHRIDKDEFVQAFLNNIHITGYWVSAGIKARYEISNVTPKLAEELPWLKEVVALLKSEVAVRKGRLSGMILEDFLKDWESALEYCEEFILDQ